MISFQSKYFSGKTRYSDIKNSVQKIIKYYHRDDILLESIDVVILYCNQLISQSGDTYKHSSNKTFASTKEILDKAGIKLKVQVPVEKRGLFGFRKTVMETRTIEVDGKTFKEMQKERKNRPYTVQEMMFYDDIFDED